MIWHAIVSVMKPPVVRCDSVVELRDQIATTNVDLSLRVGQPLFGPFFVFTGVKPKVIEGSVNRTPKGDVFGELGIEADPFGGNLPVARNAIQWIVTK